MAKTTLIKFNVKNVKAAFKDELGEFQAPMDVAYANSLSLEADYNETKIYGDGQVIAILADDKGKTGTLSVTNIEKEYEIACGRMMEIAGGIADIQQRSSVEHALYYEVEATKDGKIITIKIWLFGCITGKASETYNQTQDDPTINTFDYPLTNLGINLKNALGTSDYVDDNGNTIKITRLTSYPDDEGYATFATTVPVPKVKA